MRHNRPWPVPILGLLVLTLLAFSRPTIADDAPSGNCNDPLPDPVTLPTTLGTSRPDTDVPTASTQASAGAAQTHSTVSAHAPLPAAPRADAAMETASADFGRGALADACNAWKRAASEYAAAGRAAGQFDAMLNLSAAEQALGHYREAGQSFSDAAALADRLHDRPRALAVLGGLGSLYTLTRQLDEADILLTQGLALAREAGDAKSLTSLLNDLGNLRAAQGRDEDARTAYEQAADAARNSGNQESVDHEAVARALANAALSASRGAAADRAKTADTGQAASDQARMLPDGHGKAMLLIAIGRAFAQSGKSSGPEAAPADPRLLRLAYDAYQEALTAAAGDETCSSYALGYTGNLYELEGRADEAMQLSRRAEFLAQHIRSPFAQYRWQWQIGRLLAAKGETEPAIAAYTRAADTLQSVQADLAFGYGNQSQAGPFRESVGSLYYELADLMLRRADGIQKEEDLQRSLREARGTVELLKQAELEDYFQDRCANRLKARDKSVEEVDSHTAVIYLIPLADRTEMLVGIGPRLRRVRSPAGSAELIAQVRELRDRLEDRTTNRFLKPSRKLYDWLIRPIQPKLEESGVDTLVFVPDGALRTIPMGVLNDGTQFLAARYAIAVSPGLALTDPRPIRRTNVNVLEAGLSKSVEGFPALEFVPAELSSVRRQFGGVELIDETFTKLTLRRELIGTSFSVVHIASHAQFGGDINHTFLLTYGRDSEHAGHLTLDELRRDIQPSRVREQPIELLTLSACQTAAGDDRAALGLAGVAIKAGARSAVATLWSVNDEASEQLISEFYTELRQNPTLSKAKAMQHAQLKLIDDPRYRHPFYWSPYLVIGNWL